MTSKKDDKVDQLGKDHTLIGQILASVPNPSGNAYYFTKFLLDHGPKRNNQPYIVIEPPESLPSNNIGPNVESPASTIRVFMDEMLASEIKTLSP